MERVGIYKELQKLSKRKQAVRTICEPQNVRGKRGIFYKVPSLILAVSVFTEHSAQLCHISIRSSSTTSSRG